MERKRKNISNKKPILIWRSQSIFLPVAFGLIILLASCLRTDKINETEKVLIIFDSDMGPDYDDIGALAVLHALADNQECEILATIVSNQYPANAIATETINRYFKRGKIPVGIAGPDAPNIAPPNKYTDSIAAKFLAEPNITNNYVPSLKLYRKILSSQIDSSVTIVSIGFLSNLKELLESGSDEFSSLTGYELVRKKVKKLVSMSARLPQGREYNIFIHPEAGIYTFDNWPTQILLSGSEIGHFILTGNPVSKTDTIDNPVAWAYNYNFESTPKSRTDNLVDSISV